MARKVLILGGTRYFGKRLALHCLSSGDQVTLITRRAPEGEFAHQVEHLKADREDEAQLRRVVSGRRWDVIWDQVCFSSTDAWAAARLFEGRVGKYIFTSTQSVYMKDGEVSERDFDPKKHPLVLAPRGADYQSGKQGAEAAFAQKCPFPVTMVRFPIVLGVDDYTQRLKFHVDRVREGRPAVIENPNARASFVSSEEAAMFLLWCSRQSFSGPVNACSPQSISIGELIGWIESACDRKAVITSSGQDADFSPLVGATSRFMSSARAADLGFEFSKLSEWLPDLISSLARPR